MLHNAIRVILATTWLTLSMPSVHAGWINNLQPRASGAPSCTASCPAHDSAGGGIGSYFTNTNSNVLVCEYLSQSGTSSFCDYNGSTGSFVGGTSNSHCPTSAPLGNCSPTKRSAATKRNIIAAKPQPAAVPLNMRSLTALKKSKLAARNLRAFEVREEEK
ncbi:hypothetical protein FRB95_006113 [Tulasnella sp. JGI-2019a]|nr:hypothetical protein FRB95_006113 [Tulasnella sp. JGI-2019a]